MGTRKAADILSRVGKAAAGATLAAAIAGCSSGSSSGTSSDAAGGQMERPDDEPFSAQTQTQTQTQTQIQAQIQAQIHTPTPTPTPTPTLAVEGIDRLLGSVRLAHNFEIGSEEEFVDVLVFSPADGFTTGDGRGGLRSSDPDKRYQCTVLSSGRYFCTIDFIASGDSELFVFSLGDDSVGTGDFEFCPDPETGPECVDELFDSADGTVTVTVDREAMAMHAEEDSYDVATELAYKFVDDQASASSAVGAEGRSSTRPSADRGSASRDFASRPVTE